SKLFIFEAQKVSSDIVSFFVCETERRHNGIWLVVGRLLQPRNKPIRIYLRTEVCEVSTFLLTYFVPLLINAINHVTANATDGFDKLFTIVRVTTSVLFERLVTFRGTNDVFRNCVYLSDVLVTEL